MTARHKVCKIEINPYITRTRSRGTKDKYRPKPVWTPPAMHAQDGPELAEGVSTPPTTCGWYSAANPNLTKPCEFPLNSITSYHMTGPD